MRLVAVKSAEQQPVLTVHRARALLVRQGTMAADALGAAFAEFGVVAPQGRRGLQQLVAEPPAPAAVPAPARICARKRARGVKDSWLAGLLARRPVKVAAVARAAVARAAKTAAKTARIVWAMLAGSQAYRAPLAQAA
jgi:hypothetical protein